MTGNIGQPFGANACFALRVVSLDGGLVCVVRCQGSPWSVEGQVGVAGIPETNVAVGRCCRRVLGVSFSAGDSRPGIASVRC